MAERLRTSYDDITDVFYVTVSAETPGRYREDEEGLIWRYNARGEPIGVTVQAFAMLWGARRGSLVERIAEPFRLDKDAVARRLPETADAP